MGSRLRDMIRAVRACKTAAEERAVIARECANLRTAFKEDDHDYRHRNVAKLMFIHMLGYPTHFGQMECLKLIASPGFPEKRIGYLGLMLLLDEKQEVLMLVTNSLKNDLNHSNQFISGLALCALGNVCTAEMARDLAPEVEKLLQNSNSYIRKKAALCSVRIVRKVPDLIENFLNPCTSLLNDKHHGVLLGAVKLCTELCEGSVEALEHFRKHTMTLVRVLKNLVVSGYAPEYDVGGITDPFLQIRVLRLLRLLGNGDSESSDVMSDILAQVATNTESNKNAGNAILYECVQTIMGIEAIGGLRVLAINILGRFLANRDNNIRYVALNTLVKVVSVDTQAVQRHRTTIVECVKDSDVSIRRRALDLVYALVNETNVKTLTKELLEYLKVSDPEFKADLTGKICSLVQKFSPSKVWYIDQMINVMVEAGKFVKDEVIRALLLVVSNAPDLHGYTVRALYRAFAHWDGQESFAQVVLWCIGEYGEMLVNNANELEGEEPITVTESDAVDVLENVLKDFRVSSSTRAFALTAMLKLSSRFPSCADRIKEVMMQYKGNLILELQQRAIEFTSILSKHQNIKGALLEKMPALDATAYSTKRADAAGVSLANGRASIHETGPVSTSNGPGSQPILTDLLDLNVDDTPAPPVQRKSAGDVLLDLLGANPSAPSAPQEQTSGGGSDVLMDLLSVGSSSRQPVIASSGLDSLSQPIKQSFVEARKPTGMDMDLLGDLGDSNAPMYPTILAYQSEALSVTFEFKKVPENPQLTLILASYANASGKTYTDFVFQAAVPKYLHLRLEPASNSELEPKGGERITQTIRVENSMLGQKPLAMRIRISYKVDGQDVLEQGQVHNFPAGF
ncbi:AP-1 complex subunit gamma-2 isoform X2 [Selaginella moellendorffii]|uniref:AP-1 complex subunit gamma-2 isoform X2 n=1 Tax=Selaginella moellendorffii TaxID=88036 RepID=UPI000D1C8F68|nr:AP-1 complex subunit gamma-2 isoform X2 [Selaginella moellendorffii]|eukprot:XP_024542965.1 AP-1 complex subunit gamma-2 isoform X2 [Selaginella moellendorffii]